MNIFEWDESIPVTANNLNEMQNIINQNTVDGFQQKPAILWSNPNPTADFASQNITLSSSDWDVLEVFFAPNSLTGNAVASVKGFVGRNIRLVSADSTGGVGYRNLTYNSKTSFTASEGTQNGTTQNRRCVPLYIIGYKTGLF